MKTEQFLLTVRSSLFTVELKNLTRKQKENSPQCYEAFFTTVFRVVEKLCAVFKFIFAEKKLFNAAQVDLTKLLRNEAKIYQETDFLSTEGHLVTSPGCFLTLTSSFAVSYLTHFAITSLVLFAELCILLCCEVFVLKFK